MKKIFAIVIALVMIVSCASVLSGCGRKASIVGKWTAEVDLAEIMGSAMEGTDFDETPVTLTMEFDDDGSVEVSFDEDEVIEGIIKEVKSRIKDQYGMDFDEFISAAGFEDEEEALDSILGELDTSQLSHKGIYKLDGDKLDLADNEEDFGNNILTIKLTEKELVLKDVDSAESDDEEGGFNKFNEMLPITFKRK